MNHNGTKKYDDCIDFPVEIVGRDGGVRFYSFEESISLYQRRIRLSKIRFSSPELQQKEREHCTSRIAQLRRSFYTRYGWDVYRLEQPLETELSIEYSGEIAAYLKRVFGCGSQRAIAKLNPLINPSINSLSEESNAQYWMLSIQIETWQGILYCSNNIESIEQITNQFGTEPQLDLEYIVDGYSTNDFAIVVTSIGRDLDILESDDTVDVQSINSAYQAISDGQLVEALAHLIWLVEAEPYNKQAYWAGMIIAEQLRIHEQGLMLANMSSAYFPNEKMFGLKKLDFALRLRRVTKDSELKNLLAEYAESKDSRLLQAVYLIQKRRYHKAFKLLSVPYGVQQSSGSSTAKQVKQSSRWLHKQLLFRILCGNCGLIFSVLLAAGGLWMSSWFLAVIPFVVLLILGVDWLIQMRIQRALLGRGYIQLTLYSNNNVYALSRQMTDAH